jgi:N-formylglutamate amidohydrolase
MSEASWSSSTSTVPGVLQITLVRGERAPEGEQIDLLFEVPHGATATDDFTEWAEQLRSPLPEGLVDFFHVNTDAGAPELALATAQRFVAAQPTKVAAIARCRVPRTFIDCNRRSDATAEDFRAGKVTPGLMPWITDAADRELLRRAYDRYVAEVAALLSRVPAEGGLVMLHSYAPRTVDVQVDGDIVKNLRRAYQPEIEPTWPLRPEVDVIGKALDGTDHSPPEVVARLREQLAALGVTLANSETYPLHPSTLAWDHVMARPGRALCVEVRRDLVADPFDPFAQMRIGSFKVAPLAEALAQSLLAWW